MPNSFVHSSKALSCCRLTLGFVYCSACEKSSRLMGRTLLAGTVLIAGPSSLHGSHAPGQCQLTNLIIQTRIC